MGGTVVGDDLVADPAGATLRIPPPLVDRPRSGPRLDAPAPAAGSQRRRLGGGPAAPTTTWRPRASSTSTGTASGCRVAGDGLGNRPGHGAPTQSGRAAGRSAPRSTPAAGTSRSCSPGPRPPAYSGTRTASVPSRPWTRAMARTARSAAPVSAPQKPSWRPSAATTSSGWSHRWAMPAEGRWRTLAWSQPSICQRTRSAMAPALSAPSWRHTRSERSPCSVSALMTMRVHTEPRASRRAWSSSAMPRATKAMGATCSAGGSSSADTTRSGGGGSVAGGRGSRPQARRWASSPSDPKRPSTSAAGRAARSPRECRPRRASTSASSGRSSAPRESGARYSAARPGATTHTGGSPPPDRFARTSAVRAAWAAAKGPSATPTAAGAARTSATTSRARAARASSPPK